MVRMTYSVAPSGTADPKMSGMCGATPNTFRLIQKCPPWIGSCIVLSKWEASKGDCLRGSASRRGPSRSASERGRSRKCASWTCGNWRADRAAALLRTSTTEQRPRAYDLRTTGPPSCHRVLDCAVPVAVLEFRCLLVDRWACGSKTSWDAPFLACVWGLHKQ